MSAEELRAWDSMSPAWVQHIELTRLATTSKERPTRSHVELVGRILCGAVIAGKGYADPTYQQIRDKAHGCLKTDSQVKRALKVLETAQAIGTISRPTRGKQGKAGRAPKRVVLFTLSPEPNHGSPKRTVISDESRVANDRITGRLDTNHGSPKRTALIQDPYKPLENEQSEQVRVTAADSLQKGKKNKEQEPETQQLPAHIAHRTFEQMTTRALDFAANADPMFKPGSRWFISNRGKMQHTLMSLINKYPHAGTTALEQAAALEFYNELDPGGTLQHRHPELYQQLTGDTPTQDNPDSLGEQIASMFALPPDAVSF